jgi:hypothetical protein
MPPCVASPLLRLFCNLLLYYAVSVSIGESKGQTLLPLPATDTQQQDQAARDKAKIHILESAVVTWSKQIRNVLKSDPDLALKVGQYVLRVPSNLFLHPDGALSCKLHRPA